MAAALEKISRILKVEPASLDQIEKAMVARGKPSGVFEAVQTRSEKAVEQMLGEINLTSGASAEEVRAALRHVIRINEAQLLKYLDTVPGNTEFDKAANLAKRIAKVGRGFFLKKAYGQDIIRKCKPQHLLDFLGYQDVEELLRAHDVTEIFSALRFIETDEWMHETFEKAYSGFTAADFEEREIEIKVLGSEWHEIALKFVAKKHHNVSHLKEFGVIFLNPIKEDVQGKFVRDFALLLHYFHEIEFYSKLFKRYSLSPDFAMHLKSLLRGDVRDTKNIEEGEWLIVQRYLFKDNPNDPRLSMPRVNPESVHWFRGERDLVRLGEEQPGLELKLWHNLDWVGGVFHDGAGEVVSFDLEDNAMSEVSAAEGKKEFFNYHQREAMWTKIFMEYAGGETEMEKLLIENFGKGSVRFGHNI